MATPGRRPRSGRQYAFSLRNLSVCFGLIAIVLFAVGVAVRAGDGTAEDLSAAAVAMGLPALFVVLMMRRRRVAPAPPEEDLLEEVDFEAMAPGEFEQEVADLCERDGCQVIRVAGGAGDLGADVLATAPDGRRLVIQCKRYDPTHKVGSQDVQRFGGTCFAVHDAQIAAVVTTSEFTEPAVEYAAQCGILCIDGHELATWASTGPAPWTE
ncbi:putative membrane protein [Streptomyces himastatinicus ATCC 53653]|uniref:Putative membrane protein n=1 Tax=Streptomyces himastatinicus ATCC 53653 TaxID=457427 RepID=D9W7K7_9ACTN|nr:restriction endonuclease [Streptomyces himastatinicus]EFL28787.1 putative membrane protein [Streptomyces himastatinicus ATCC 53653]